ncbi:MAG: TetR/AcrR family transcriptional regulator [Polyangiales bacterium]
MAKGSDTKRAIVDEALSLTSVAGITGLSIGELARTTGMSKSGLFAHFGSKEQLQLTVIHAARERFVDLVVAPSIKEPRGEARVRSLFERSMKQWEEDLPGGCIFYSLAAELDDQPGAPRDALLETQVDFQAVIRRAADIAIEEGHFRKDLDLDQFAFEFASITSGFHFAGRLLRRPDAAERAQRAFDALLERSR